MVAHAWLTQTDAPALPLLIEPTEKPPVGTTPRGGGPGWRRVRVTRQFRGMDYIGYDFERNHDHDQYGAQVQHMIALYCLGGVQRQSLAKRFGVSERQVQAYLNGTAWRVYAQPVLDALRRMGIGQGRGSWHAVGETGTFRTMEILAAAAKAVGEATDLLEAVQPEAANDLRTRLRLLAFADLAPLMKGGAS
jgi:hypothetical protein